MANGLDFSMTFSPESMVIIDDLLGWEGRFSPELAAAILEAGMIIIDYAQEAMSWQNPTGALEESLTVNEDNPFMIEVGSPLDYARRRDFGFSGMTDSLGRFYAYDPGLPYMETGIQQALPEITELLQEAVDKSWAIGGI